MIPNIHSKTGIPFGVVDARDLPYLWDEIITNGVDNRYNAAREEAENRLKAAETVEERNAVLKDHHVDPVEDMDDEVESLLDSCMESYESDSDSTDMDYESDGYKYHLTSLGGAPLLYVIESPYVAPCRPCSPCCPNAGDLNNIDTETGGLHAYCFDPEDFDPLHDGEGKNKFRIVELDGQKIVLAVE